MAEQPGPWRRTQESSQGREEWVGTGSRGGAVVCAVASGSLHPRLDRRDYSASERAVRFYILP